MDETGSGDSSTTILNKTSNAVALFKYAYSGATTEVISEVSVKVRAKKSSRRSNLKLQGVLRVSGIDYPSDAAGLSTDYSTYTFVFP